MEKNLQKLRFKKFTSVPNIDRLGDYSVKIGSGKTPKGGASVYQDEGILLIRSQNVLNGQLDLKEVAFISDEINDTMRNSEVYSNDVLLNITGASIGRCAIAPERFPLANVNQHVCIIRVDEEKLSPHYVMQQILSPRIQNQINSFQAGGNREGLNFQQIRGFEIVIHDIAEQTKIADFLSTIDSRITNQSAKVDTLTELKKGIMQKIFSQEIRFKREDGGEYPDWTFNKINEIFEFYSTNSLSRDKLTAKESLMKNIHYGDIHTKFKSTIDIASVSLPSIKDLYSNDLSNYQLAIDGDVFIADASEDYADIGKATEILNINGNKIVGGLHVLHLRDLKHKYVNGFRGYLFNSDEVRKQIKLLAVGSKVLGISKPNMGKIEIPVLQREEQEKIADFLSTLDSKIDIETRILSTLQTLKKGLLQQMFV